MSPAEKRNMRKLAPPLGERFTSLLCPEALTVYDNKVAEEAPANRQRYLQSTSCTSILAADLCRFDLVKANDDKAIERLAHLFNQACRANVLVAVYDEARTLSLPKLPITETLYHKIFFVWPVLREGHIDSSNDELNSMLGLIDEL